MATAEVPQGINVKDLLEAGLHFGHQTKRWNPKMKRYIFDKRNGIHIVDLSKSLVMLKAAIEFVRDTCLRGNQILFVGTKKQAQQVIKDAAESSDQHYVTHRWLGGTLTNNATIRGRVKRLREIEALEKSGALETMHKKEAAKLRRELEKLRRNLGGIANMSSLPGVMFVVDINREAIAVAEANTLNIPVIAIVDTNCDPDPIDLVIPGNDDAIRAIKLISGAIAESAKRAGDEYAKIAAEKARKLEEERRLAEEKQKEQQRKIAEAAKAQREKEAEAKKAAKKDAEGTDEADKKPRKKPAAKKPEAVAVADTAGAPAAAPAVVETAAESTTEEPTA